MKKFLVLLSLLFSSFTYADTINLHWLNEDGTVYENSTCVIDSDLILPSTPPTKYGYTFTGWKMANYIPIEYLESTGTQYIDTEFIPTLNTKFRVKAQQTDYINGGGNIIGSRRTYENNNIAFAFATDTKNRILVDFNNGSYSTYRVDYNFSAIAATYPIFVIETSRYGRYVYSGDENTILASNTVVNNQTFSITDSSFLFNRSGQSNEPLKGRIYYAKIYNNNILVRDFIPVLDNNNVPCMFDRVEGKFYYNQGTGQFIAGPVLQ